MRGRVSIFIAAAVAALACGAMAVAGTSHVSHATSTAQRAYNSSDQALARAIALKGRDFGPSSTWSGGQTEPDTSQPRTCANFNPRRSDLVITGDAESDYVGAGGVTYRNEVQIMKTAHMVRLDWQRDILDPAALPCLRTFVAGSLPAGENLVSLTRLSVPHVATYAAGYRALIDQHLANNQTIRTMIDVLFVGRDRTELTLESTAAYTSHAAVERTEFRLARSLVARIPDHS
jgi:hypothetical protein